MTPSARIQTAIEILDDILSGTPAEKALTGWARKSRFAGSKDRAAVRDHVFDALRRRASAALQGGSDDGRGIMLGVLAQDEADLERLFSGDGYGAAPMTEAEVAAVAAKVAEPVDLPDWIVPMLRTDLGTAFPENADALRQRAPVCLRVNLKKTTRDAAQLVLQDDGVTTAPMSQADTALQVLEGPRKVAVGQAYQTGLVELQDVSSQAAIAALPWSDGQRVLDYCAGGGGKLLAIAGRMEGAFFAHDANPDRMQDLPARAARAGVDVEIVAPDSISQHAPFDVVFCDVPCSGSGTWRRTPDAKWRFTAEMLDDLNAVQAQILQEASGLVAQGGMLVYATCSLLAAENGDQVDKFVQENPEWSVVHRQQKTLADGSDGFFFAQLTRV